MNGDKAWAWVMELCKKHGIAPAQNSGLFEIVTAVRERDKYRDRLQIDPGGSDKIDELEESIGFLRFQIRNMEQAILDCINAPKGVVPDSATPFYDANRVHQNLLASDKGVVESMDDPPSYVIVACYDNAMHPKLSSDCSQCKQALSCQELNGYVIKHN
jgi:hypothetical protein